jgi:hypothetical protein
VPIILRSKCISLIQDWFINSKKSNSVSMRFSLIVHNYVDEERKEIVHQSIYSVIWLVNSDHQYKIGHWKISFSWLVTNVCALNHLGIMQIRAFFINKYNYGRLEKLCRPLGPIFLCLKWQPFVNIQQYLFWQIALHDFIYNYFI